MEVWQTEILNYMEVNNLSQKQMAKKINENGGDIKSSGFSHWMKTPPRSIPSKVNIMALEKILDGKIRFISNA